MDIRQAKRYFAENQNAELYVVPRRHTYVLQVRDRGKLDNIRYKRSNAAITCETIEQVNHYAKKLNKLDYHFVHNCPHVEMGGFDRDHDNLNQREDNIVVSLKDASKAS